MALAYRETWSQMQENRIFLLYMFIGVGLFGFIYYHTAKSPLDLAKLGYNKTKEIVNNLQETYVPPVTNYNNKMTEYNMQGYANQRQQQYDARDMGSIAPPPVEPFTSLY